MGLGGGKFTDFNKTLNGTYTRTITQGQPYVESVQGIVAGGIVSDWAPENELFVIEKEDFENDPVAVTGYSYTDPNNALLREVFSHAIRLYTYKLNKGGLKAKADSVGEAVNTGSVGNKITVSVLRNIIDQSKFDVVTYLDGIEKDSQTVAGKQESTISLKKGEDQTKDTLPSPTASFQTDGLNVTVTYKDMLVDYDTVSTIVKKDGEECHTGITIDKSDLTETVKFGEDAVDGEYKVEARVKKSGVSDEYTTLKTLTITLKTTPETLKLEKTNEQAGETIESESVDLAIEGLNAKLTYASLPEGYTTLKTLVKLQDSESPAGTKVTNAELVDTVEFEKTAAKGVYTVEARLQNAEEDIKTIKTYSIELKVDEPQKRELTGSSEEDGTTLDSTKAEFKLNNKTLTVNYSNLLKEYSNINVAVLFGGVENYESTEKNQVENTVTLTFKPEIKGGTYTIEARVNSDSGDVKTIASTTITADVNASGIEGADGSKLEDNKFVVFSDDLIPENAGYVFSGGTSGTTVTVADHSNFLNLLEGRSFNVLYYDGNDEVVKAIYDEYTRRLRDNRGLYFQCVLQNYNQADYEGIISVYNEIKNPDQVKTLTPWLAGLLSSLDYNQEATNTVYDGELTIIANLSQSRMEVLVNSGHFFFHESNIDEVSTYEDVNTFRSFTEEKNDEVSQNKTIRIVDFIHNEIARVSNRKDIGKLSNTDDGRNVLWTRIDSILTQLVDIGAIGQYEATDIKVLPIKDQKNSVEIRLNITINGTIRKIYVTAYVIK